MIIQLLTVSEQICSYICWNHYEKPGEILKKTKNG